MMSQSWFAVFASAPLSLAGNDRALVLATTMLKKVVSSVGAEFGFGKCLRFFLEVHRTQTWAAVHVTMAGGAVSQYLLFRYLRYLMYTFTRAVDWTFEFFESNAQHSMVPLARTRRAFAKFVTEFVREVLSDPCRKGEVRRVFDIYQRAVLFEIRSGKYEFSVIELYARLAMAILRTSGLDHGMADLSQTFCILNGITDWEKADAGVLAEFFRVVLAHSQGHFNPTEVERFVVRMAENVGPQKVAVLKAIVEGAVVAFRVIAKERMRLVEEIALEESPVTNELLELFLIAIY
jgi:hypothetical protein